MGSFPETCNNPLFLRCQQHQKYFENLGPKSWKLKSRKFALISYSKATLTRPRTNFRQVENPGVKVFRSHGIILTYENLDA